MKKIQVIGIGEAITDVIQGKTFAGGAPANFAQITQALDYASVLVSAIGKDENGSLLLNQLKERNVNTDFIQVKKTSTGTAQVTLDGIEPSFELSKNAAYDFMEWNKELAKLTSKNELVCFGTLGQRNPSSRKVIQKFVKESIGKKLFDVNLRAKWNAHLVKEIIHPCMKYTHILKMNEQESFYFRKWLKQKTHEKLARKLFGKYKNLELIAITQGENGCELFTRKQKTQVSGFSVKAVDCTGCGDAFSAGLAITFLEGKKLEEMGEFANASGAITATEMGATPVLTRKKVEKFLEQKRII